MVEGKAKMNKRVLAVLLSVTMVLTLGCGIINNLTNLAGGGAGTVANLWPDVPLIDGATKAKIDLPLPARLAVQAAFQGKLEFISYTTTKTPEEVQQFYTTERMKSSGWSSDTNGCMGTGGDTATSTPGQATLCVFSRKDQGKEIGLAIFVLKDDKSKPASLFFMRIDITSTPTPAN
jgi:hypothetical protein